MAPLRFILPGVCCLQILPTGTNVQAPEPGSLLVRNVTLIDAAEQGEDGLNYRHITLDRFGIEGESNGISYRLVLTLE